MSNPISDPGLTRREQSALKGLLASTDDHPDFTLSPDHKSAAEKIKAALSAPEEDSSGVEKAVEVLAKRRHEAKRAATVKAFPSWEELSTSHPLRRVMLEQAEDDVAAIRPLLSQQGALSPEIAQHLREILSGEADGFDPRCILCAQLCGVLAVPLTAAVTLTQQPVLLSDEELGRLEWIAQTVETVSPQGRKDAELLRKLAQHHVPTKGQGER